MKEFFKVLGIGQCGARLTLLLEEKGLDCSYFNFDDIDFKDIRNSRGKKLLLDGKGTGRSIKKGKILIEKYRLEIEKFIDEIVEKNKIFILVGGLGGGTFSSSLNFFIDELNQRKIKFGILATLPHSKVSGGLKARENAYGVLKEIRNEDNSFFILADNEHLSKKVEINPLLDGWQKVNNEIIRNFLAIEQIVQNRSTGKGVGSIDKNELLSVLVSGGYTTILSELVWFNDLTKEDFDLNKFFKRHELVQGYDYRSCDSFAISFVVPQRELPKYVNSFIENVLNKFNKLSQSGFYGIFFKESIEPSLSINILASALPLPSSISSRVNNLKRDEDRAKEKRLRNKKREELIFDGLKKASKEKPSGDFDF